MWPRIRVVLGIVVAVIAMWGAVGRVMAQTCGGSVNCGDGNQSTSCICVKGGNEIGDCSLSQSGGNCNAGGQVGTCSCTVSGGTFSKVDCDLDWSGQNCVYDCGDDHKISGGCNGSGGNYDVLCPAGTEVYWGNSTTGCGYNFNAGATSWEWIRVNPTWRQENWHTYPTTAVGVQTSTDRCCLGWWANGDDPGEHDFKCDSVRAEIGTCAPICSATAPATVIMNKPDNGGKVPIDTVSLQWWNIDPNWGTACGGNNNRYAVYVGTVNDVSSIKQVAWSTSTSANFVPMSVSAVGTNTTF